MPRQKRPRSILVPPPKSVFQLKITLRYIKPPIWRRVVVPDNLLLGDLHYVIYPAMGWGGYHMHTFRFGGGFNPVEYAMTQILKDCCSGVRSEDTVFLGQVIKRKGQTFSYEYDFGDSWQHEIKVEKILPFDPSMRLPVCLDGQRACPPEDCGGVPGYYDALDALSDASTPEQRQLREWLGGYAPEQFNLDESNRRLLPNKRSKSR